MWQWSVTLLSWITRPARSPPGAYIPLVAPGTRRTLGSWYTRLSRGAHWLLDGSRLTADLINEHVKLQHLLCETQTGVGRSRCLIYSHIKMSGLNMQMLMLSVCLLCTSCSQACVTSW